MHEPTTCHVVAAGYREILAPLKADEAESLLELQGYLRMNFPGLEIPENVSINPPSLTLIKFKLFKSLKNV